MTAAVQQETAPARRSRTRVLREVLRKPAAAVSIGYVLLLVVLAIGGRWIAPHDPDVQDLGNRFAGPSLEHWFGTDDFGRDVASRIINAAAVTISAPAISVGIAVAIGLPLGLWAAVRGGWVDAITGRLADTVLALPALVGALAIVAVLGPGLVTTMIAVGIIFSPAIFRVVRGAALAVTEETFIRAADAVGSSRRRTLWVHVLPNIAAPLLVQTTILMGVALLVEASLSFLGLGVQPPDASWGSMLKAAYANQFDAPYAVVPPGIAMVLTVLAFNTIGDAIRDAVGLRRRT
ncbi:peptide/nickel transport system permease protein [Pseudonocardia thermophila]|uniref:Peptide/nickel transport system permease protein n=1 Tax=Pseudonocardia thermophila TaxID=1848 RepID=A0A1M6XZL2_PSETH|nr:ABC transporter permease [Pseudonocardia thermophila]SHL11319.1 peptide/nickel transport system permease protein [Pseudonocardia thermophila]